MRNPSEPIIFFDSNTIVGRLDLEPNKSYSLEPEAIVDQMRYVGIAKALTYHSSAKHYRASSGNDALLEEISYFPELQPSWVLKPSRLEKMDEPDVLVEKMLKSNVRAGRMFPTPKDYNYFLAQWSVGGLLDEMESRRIPLFIDLGFFEEDEPDWAIIDDLCGLHSDLPVVLAGVHSENDWILYPFMRSHHNFYLELSIHYVRRGIEDICSKFGPDRLIFASGLPLTAPEETMAMVTHAHISSEERELIAAGNLENLLSNVIAQNRILQLEKQDTAKV